jgi:hypothetical protein
MSDANNQVRTESARGTDQSGGVPRSARRWTRARTIWLLITLSLSPGVAAAVARDWWAQLPAGVRLSAYILSGILIVAACSLIVLQEDTPTERQS